MEQLKGSLRGEFGTVDGKGDEVVEEGEKGVTGDRSLPSLFSLSLSLSLLFHVEKMEDRDLEVDFDIAVMASI
jgi:hypothetical protein